MIPKDFTAKGNLFVFVDEAHRTQSGKMHDAMKQLLPEAMFIGFTGTPLLKADKETSIETFGSFIHTYKFDEAVEDGVVLDLRYEARNIDQDLTSPAKVDTWFEAKTKGMTDLSKAELKKRWGTMQKVVSSEPRAQQIVNDILLRHGDQAPADGRARQRHARRIEHLPGLQVLRAVLPRRFQGQVRHRHLLRTQRRRHLQGGLRRGRDREAPPVRHLPADAGRSLR